MICNIVYVDCNEETGMRYYECTACSSAISGSMLEYEALEEMQMKCPHYNDEAQIQYEGWFG